MLDGTTTSYTATGGANIGRAMTALGLDETYSLYDTCGFFTDSEFLDCLDYNMPLWQNTTLYTKTATLDKLSFVDNTTYYSVRARLTDAGAIDTSISGEVVFPAYYDPNGADNGLPVTHAYANEWNSGGFYRCASVTNYVFSTAMTTLGQETFSNNNALTKLYINSNITSLLASFSYETNLTEIKVSKYNPVYEDWGCNIVVNRSTKTLMIGCNTSTIPEGIKAIGNLALGSRKFTNTTLVLPESITNIYVYAFAYANVKEITISKNITNIANNALYMSSLKTVIIDSATIYTKATAASTTVCGGMLINATTVKVLKDIDDGSNTFLTENYTKTQEGNYYVYTK